MTAELKGIHAKTFHNLDVIKDVLKLDEEKIAELEKENAELKEELKDANKKVVHLACNQNKDLKRKINKAKEIIKTLTDDLSMYSGNYQKELLEAKQFIKDSEVEK